MRYEKKTFQKQTVAIDGNEYIDCVFIDCDLKYAGGEFSFANLKTSGSFSLGFSDAANSTLLLLQIIAAANAVGRNYIIGLIDGKTKTTAIPR